MHTFRRNWTCKKKKRQVPEDRATCLLPHTITHSEHHTHSRRYTATLCIIMQARARIPEQTQTVRTLRTSSSSVRRPAAPHRMLRRRHATKTYAHAHVQRALAATTRSWCNVQRNATTRSQPPSKGSLRGSKCTPLCNSQLPACKPIVCRRSQVSKSYIDAEQRRQRSSISILAVRRRARALSSRSDQ